MSELLRTNDAVLLSFAQALLNDAGIGNFIADFNMSIFEGSIGLLPRRIMVETAEAGRGAPSFVGCRARRGIEGLMNVVHRRLRRSVGVFPASAKNPAAIAPGWMRKLVLAAAAPSGFSAQGPCRRSGRRRGRGGLALIARCKQASVTLAEADPDMAGYARQKPGAGRKCRPGIAARILEADDAGRGSARSGGACRKFI